MRGKTSEQLSFADGFLDPSFYKLDEELKKVDQLLSNSEFLQPFEAVFDETMGRPGTPVDVYLRMMYLKFHWGLSYEEVETEVRERIPWRLFCHLSLMDHVPDSTTLIKLNQRFGDELIGTLNKRLGRSSGSGLNLVFKVAMGFSPKIPTPFSTTSPLESLEM